MSTMAVRLGLLTVFGLVAVFSVPAAGDIAVLDGVGSLEGHVKDFTTDAPLAGVGVVLLTFMQSPDGYEYWMQVSSTQTDDTGRYEFSDLAPGMYKVEVYEDFVDDVMYMGEWAEVDVEAGVASVLDLRLRRAASIWGYVYDETGAPMPGATVQVEAPYEEESYHMMRTGETDAQGRYEVILPPCAEKFFPVSVASAIKPGSRYKVFGAAADPDWPDSMWGDLAAAGYTELGGGTASAEFAGGYLYYVIQAPAANVVGLDAIKIATDTYYSGGLWGGNVNSLFEAYGPPDGKACLTGEWPGQSSYIGFTFTTAPSSITLHMLDLGGPDDPVVYVQQTAPDLYGASPEGTRGPDFHLAQGGTLHGRAVNQAGEPLPGVYVLALLGDGGGMGGESGTTDGNGEFWFAGVPTGVDVYLETVTYMWPWYEHEGKRYALGERWLGPYRTTPGSVTEIPDLVVPEAGSVQGVVRDAGGQPVEGAYVSVFGIDVFGGTIGGDDEDGHGYHGTGSDGVFEQQVPAGTIIVFAEADGFQDYRSEPIAVAPGQTVEHDVQLAPEAPEQEVLVTGQLANFAQAAPRNADGVVLPYEFEIDYEEFGFFGWLGVAAFPTNVEWTPDALLVPDVFFSDEASVEDGCTTFYEASAQPAGSFELDLPPGMHTAFPVRDSAEALGGWSVLLGDPVSVEGPASGVSLTIPMGTGTVRGNVIFPEGHPGAVREDSALIYLRQVGSTWPLGRSIGSPDAASAYRLPDLPAGTYCLYAVSFGLDPFTSDTFTLGDGQTVVRDIIFGSGPRDLYVDDDAAGDPAPGDPSVSDPSENGTQAHPYDAIQEAVDAARDGDTVIVMEGTYRENIIFRSKAVFVRSSNPDDPAVVAATVIDGQSSGSVIYLPPASGLGAGIAGFTIRNGSGIDGGGIACQADVIIGRNTITGNVATQECGGGIWVDTDLLPTDGKIIISENLIQFNSSALVGGGICVTGGAMGLPDRVIIAGNEITTNSAQEDGGGILSDVSVQISNNTVAGNQASRHGGGIFLQGSSASIANAMIAHNSCSGSGGGVHATGEGAPTLTNVTIADNYAAQSGGGICCATGSNVTVKNAILWGNASPAGAQIALRDASVLPAMTVSYSDVAGGQAAASVEAGTLTWGSGNIDADPLFGDTASDNYHLKSKAGRYDFATDTWVTDAVISPCIDAGDPASSYANEPNPHGLRINMGAFGNTPVASKNIHWPIPGDVNGDCRVNILDLIAIRGKLNLSVTTGDNWVADVTGDGRINILDLILVRSKLNTKCN